MIRGEVWWIRFGPGIGGEMQKDRPAVIVSNDQANQFLNRIQVVPISSRTEKVFPCEALIRLEKRPAKAMADQIATVSKERVSNRIAEVSPDEMEAIERAIRIQLGLA